MNETTLTYIISVLKEQTPHGTPDWFAALGFLSAHRIEGLFYGRAQKIGLKLPDKVEKRLRQAWERQKRQTAQLRSEIESVASALSGVETPYAFLKGSVLANAALNGVRLYADGERVSNDVDLLVAPDAIGAIGQALREAGFVQGRYDRKTQSVVPFPRAEVLFRRLNRGEVAPFVRLTENSEFPFVEVDVNFSLGNTPEDGKALLREMLSTVMRYDGDVSLPSVSTELFFLHLVMHQYKECTLYFAVERGKDLDLYKLADLYYIMKLCPLDWSRAEAIADQYGVTDRVGAVAAQVGAAFGDGEIGALARRYGDAQPWVVDYANKKTFRWTAGIRERLRAFQAEKFLEELC